MIKSRIIRPAPLQPRPRTITSQRHSSSQKTSSFEILQSHPKGKLASFLLYLVRGVGEALHERAIILFIVHGVETRIFHQAMNLIEERHRFGWLLDVKCIFMGSTQSYEGVTEPLVWASKGTAQALMNTVRAISKLKAVTKACRRFHRACIMREATESEFRGELRRFRKKLCITRTELQRRPKGRALADKFVEPLLYSLEGFDFGEPCTKTRNRFTTVSVIEQAMRETGLRPYYDSVPEGSVDFL